MKALSITFFLMFVTPHVSAQFLGCSPSNVTLRPNETAQIRIDAGGGRVKVKYDGALSAFGLTPVPDERNYAVLIPSSGTTPLVVSVGINALVAKRFPPVIRGQISGRMYVVFTTVDQTPASRASCIVDLIVPDEPAPAIRSAVNSASLQPFLSPGALVSILGSNLTGPTQSTNYGPTAFYPTSVAGASVTFNGIAAPLLYLSPNQINAIVPFALAGETSAQVRVQRFERVSAALTAPLQDTSPGIFTVQQTGSGQGAILQQGPDGQFTHNSADNPVARGAAVTIFATGAGVWTPPAETDALLYGRHFTTRPVSVTMGGQAARVLYAGTGTERTWSVLQVNAVVPDGIGSGPQPVVLKIGDNDNSQQQVTVYIL
jgi:uncharacterized protein (TIGR03437 family)